MSLLLIDSVYKMGKNYYPQVFLEECKYIVKEKKTKRYISDYVEITLNDFDDSDESDDSDIEASNKDTKRE